MRRDSHLIVTSVSKPSPPASTALSKDSCVFSGANCSNRKQHCSHQWGQKKIKCNLIKIPRVLFQYDTET